MNTRVLLYEQLAKEIASLIEQHVFRPGERLPSIRALATQKRLSVSTILQAMRVLEDQDLVDGRPQSGFYVRQQGKTHVAVAHRPSVPALYTKGIFNPLMRVLEANARRGVIPLGVALPIADMMQTQKIRQSLVTVARSNEDTLSEADYFDNSKPEFIRQIQRRAATWGQLIKDEIVVTASCIEAVSLCLRAVTKPGDSVAVEAATSFVHLQILDSLGLTALEIPADPDTGVSLDLLESAMQGKLCQACLFVPNVNNPTGSIMPDANKERLTKLLSQYDIPLIEDDACGDLCFARERPRPVKAYDTTGQVLLCSSFSKTIGSSLGLGYVAAGKYARHIKHLKILLVGASSHFQQAVVADFLSGSGYEKHLRKMRKTLSSRVDQMSDAVSTAFPRQCTISKPQGGSVIWVRLPESVDAMAYHATAIRHDIAIMPGPLFSAHRNLNNYIRINCSNPWTQRIADGIETLGQLV